MDRRERLLLLRDRNLHATPTANTQTRQVQKIRWEPSSGALDHFFDDELVPASRGVQEEMLRKIEPFPTTNELVPYNAGYLVRLGGGAVSN